MTNPTTSGRKSHRLRNTLLVLALLVTVSLFFFLGVFPTKNSGQTTPAPPAAPAVTVTASAPAPVTVTSPAAVTPSSVVPSSGAAVPATSAVGPFQDTGFTRAVVNPCADSTVNLSVTVHFNRKGQSAGSPESWTKSNAPAPTDVKVESDGLGQSLSWSLGDAATPVGLVLLDQAGNTFYYSRFPAVLVNTTRHVQPATFLVCGTVKNGG